MDIDLARRLADAVLYAGTTTHGVLGRWQFGVLMPADVADTDPSQPATAQTECVVEVGARFRLRVLLRFLQVQRRTVYRWLPGHGRFTPVDALDVDGKPFVACDEAVAREMTYEATAVSAHGPRHTLRVPGAFARTELRDARGALVGQVVRRRRPLTAALDLSAVAVPGPRRALRLRVGLENQTRAATADRDAALVASHLILSVEDGAFVSMVDPPTWAADAVESCANVGLYPVLAGAHGDDDTLLATPLILSDHPAAAAEIDEVLLLRTLAG